MVLFISNKILIFIIEHEAPKFVGDWKGEWLQSNWGFSRIIFVDYNHWPIQTIILQAHNPSKPQSPKYGNYSMKNIYLKAEMRWQCRLKEWMDKHSRFTKMKYLQIYQITGLGVLKKKKKKLLKWNKTLRGFGYLALYIQLHDNFLLSITKPSLQIIINE